MAWGDIRTGDMWASELLTINTIYPTTDIVFNFRNTTPNYTGVERVEVVMFNCPEWGISVNEITLLDYNITALNGKHLTSIYPTITSCDSLVKACIFRPVNFSLSILSLRFQLSSASTWVHLAEVSFYGASPTCPLGIILNPPTTAPPTTTFGQYIV